MPFDRRLVSKTLSTIASTSVHQILVEGLAEGPRHARVVGITGAPGAGKSTLIGRLAAHRLQCRDPLAIIAIDPTSPRTEGSLLGDRIRMEAISADPRVFIRSLPSLSAEDGLTDNVVEIIAALDRLGFEEIIIETVGAGQTAYGVRELADVEMLVLTPGAGDYVQAMKAGIMETADLYVINKADLPGADRVASELLGVLARSGTPPPVIQVSAGADTGIVELNAAVDRCLVLASDPQVRAAAERGRLRYRIRKLIQRRLDEAMNAMPEQIWRGPLRDGYLRVLRELSAEPPGTAE
jgi:LAO/AO transport system kinase